MGLRTGGGAGPPKEKKEKTNGLVGAKSRGRGRASVRKKKENKWISRAKKQRAGEGQPKERREKRVDKKGLKKGGAGRANLRKKEKTKGLVGAKKQGASRANLRTKEKTNGFVGARNRGAWRGNLRKKENKRISWGLKQGVGRAQPEEKRKRMYK